jgi:hypothetical protein
MFEPDSSDKSDEYIIGRFKIGYISGNKKNPLDDIYLYKSKNNDVILLRDSNTTILIPENYQEYITMIYLK